MDRFPQRLSQLMNENGISQYALSKAINVTRQSIAQYMDGKTQPNADKICAIADYFNVSTDYLLGRVDFRSVNLEVQEICKKTGLSECAVSSLIEMNSSDSILYDESDEDGTVEPFLEDWGERKQGVFELINRLLTWPLLEEVIFLDEEITEYVYARSLWDYAFREEKKTRYNLFLKSVPEEMEPFVIHPMDVEGIYEYAIEKRLRAIGEYAYRYKKYGTVFAKGMLYRNRADFENAIREEKKENGKA